MSVRTRMEIFLGHLMTRRNKWIRNLSNEDKIKLCEWDEEFIRSATEFLQQKGINNNSGILGTFSKPDTLRTVHQMENVNGHGIISASDSQRQAGR